MHTPHLSRRDLMRLALVAGGGLAVGGGLVACGSATPAPGGAAIKPNAKLVFASTAITSSLDPHIALSNVGRSYAIQVFDTLLTFDETGAVAPSLATAWKRIDNLTLELTLREGVTFHDGGAFTAETVVANVNRLLAGGATMSATKGFLGKITKAEAVNAKTVRLTTSAPDPVLLKRLTRIDMVDPTTFDAAGSRASGTGPFRVTGYTAGQSIQLERFAASWRSTDRVATATMQAIPDPNTLASALRAGDIDIAFGLGPTQAEQLRSAFGIVHPSAGSAAICSLIPSVEPKLRDPRVREAINLAVNRDEFVMAALAGYGRPSNGQLLQEGFTGYNPSLPPLAYDVAKAKRLLAEAGAEGMQLNIATTALFKSQAEIVAGYLTAIGIRSEVEIQELSLFIGSLLSNSKTPLLYWQTDYFDLRDIASVTRFGPQPDAVQKHFENDKYVQLFTQVGAEMDETKRESLIKDMAKVLRDEYGVLFLAWADVVYIHNKRLVEVGMTGNSLVRLEKCGKSE